MSADFTPGALDVQAHELVAHLLRATDQDAPGPVDTAALLARLRLSVLEFDFASNLPRALLAQTTSPRALLSFRDRLIALDENLKEPRARFSCLHEVAHYVLPNHQHTFYLCDERGMSQGTSLSLEAEANRFAADLMFKAGHFAREANDSKPSARTIKFLAHRYGASFEATARRLVETSLRPVMLMVFARDAIGILTNQDAAAKWQVRYCAASARFCARFFSELRGEVPSDVAQALEKGGGDIEQSIPGTIEIPDHALGSLVFHVEWFWNTWNIMALVRPAR